MFAMYLGETIFLVQLFAWGERYCAGCAPGTRRASFLTRAPPVTF